jgi:CubicO group peptidase (beta-lactamase class C family)
MNGDFEGETHPAQLGLDPKRLERLGEYLRPYVDDGRLPGWLVAIRRHGRLAYWAAYGWRDPAQKRPMTADTRVRIYSMTKPITAVAALMHWERGAFDLTDPVSAFLPAFGRARVWAGGSPEAPETVPIEEPMRIWHLFTHTAGLSYGFDPSDPVDALYRQTGLSTGAARSAGLDLAAFCDRLAEMPLVAQPGRRWHYSLATDVLGRIVEVVAGRTLDQVVQEEILEPLGMTSTGFWLEPSALPELAALYRYDPKTGQTEPAPDVPIPIERPSLFSGGGGLLSTASDYLRFMALLEGRGTVGNTRLLAPRTVELMTQNILPPPLDLTEFGAPGVGFGLGVSVVVDPARVLSPASPGSYGWGGAASTDFWIDPTRNLSVLFLTQLLPSGTYPLTRRLRQLVYQAVVS